MLYTVHGEVMVAEGPWVGWAGPRVIVNNLDSGCSGAVVSEGCPLQHQTVFLDACKLTIPAGDSSGEGVGMLHIRAHFAACGDSRSENGDGARWMGAMDD